MKSQKKKSLKSSSEDDKIKTKRSTIYDDVFRTMIEKMPQLIVPFINEVFGKSYPKDIEIKRLDGTNYRTGTKIISDARLEIQNKIYHIECQSNPDKRMVIRMLEYDVASALDNLQLTDAIQRLDFPQSCVLYLRGSGPKELNLKCVFPNGESFLYRVPCVYESQYSQDDIFEKNLLFLLPYYVIRFESMVKKKQKFGNDFYREIQEISNRLNEIAEYEENNGLYMDIAELFVDISKQVFRNLEDVSERIDDIMRGKVLELPSEKLLHEGRTEGLAEGRTEGYKSFLKLIQSGILSLDQAANAVTDKADFLAWFKLQK